MIFPKQVMSRRGEEVRNLHSNIQTEFDKMIRNLEEIHRNATTVISRLQNLQDVEMLKEYPSAFEYLSKVQLKLLEHNCSYELFFIENAKFNTNFSQIDSSTMNNSSRNDEDSNTLSRHSDVNNAMLSDDNITESLQSQFVEVDLESEIVKADLQTPIVKDVENNMVENSQTLVVKENILKDSILEEAKNKIVEDSSKRVERRTSSNYVQTNYVKEKMANETQDESVGKIAEEIYENVEDKIEDNRQTQSNIDTMFEHVETENLNKMRSTKIKQKSEYSQTLQVDVTHSTKELQSQDVKDRNDESLKTHIVKNMYTREAELHNIPVVNTTDKRQRNTINVPVLKNMMRKIVKQNESQVTVPDLRPKILVIGESSRPVMPAKPVITAKPAVSIVERPKYQPVRSEPNYNSIQGKRGPTPKVGDQCFVSCINSPDDFYIQVVSDISALQDNMSAQIAEIAPQLHSYMSKRDLYADIDYCLCYVDELRTWYRARINKLLCQSSTNFIPVHLIDYGCEYVLPLRNIRRGHPYLFELPIMAEKCKLSCVKPLPDSATSGEWSNASLRFFYNLLHTDENQIFTINFIKKTEDSFIIDLETETMGSATYEMINTAHALEDFGLFSGYMKEQILQSQGFTKDYFEMTEEEQFEANYNIEEEEIDNINIAVSHYDPEDEKNICRNMLRKGYCYKKNNCRFSHKPLNPDGWTTDREPVFYKTFHDVQIPPVGTEIVLSIVSILDLRTYYAVILKPEYCRKTTSGLVSSMKELANFMNNPEQIKTYKVPIVIPAVSQLLLVQYRDLWQRGQVTNITEGANKVELQVLLVDIGVEEMVDMRNTRLMQEQFLHLPFQVVLCKLSNITLNNITDEETENAYDYLESKISMKTLNATVVNSSMILGVNLYNEDGNSIADVFVKAGLAESDGSCLQPQSKSGLLVD